MRLDITPTVHPGFPPVVYAHGLGDDLTANQIGQGLVSAGTIGASTAIGTKNIISGTISAGLTAAAIFDPEPISKAILGAVAGLVGIFTKVFGGCGQTCIAATQVVNQVEAQYLKPNLTKWQALPLKLQSLQQQYLNFFDQAWALVLKGCGDPNLGAAGQRCISERQRGGTSAWCPNCNWFTLYRDPIANDPDVVPDNAQPISLDTTANTATFQTVSGGIVTVPVAAALIAEATAAANNPNAAANNFLGTAGAGAGTDTGAGVSVLSSIPTPLLLGGAALLLLATVGGDF